MARRRIHISLAVATIVPILMWTRADAQRADTLVKAAGKPVHAGIARLTEELSIGAVEGRQEYLFGDVSELAVTRDGSIYVFDRMVPALRKYDANGKYVRTIGREGQGPGEYSSVAGLTVLRDGRVLLWDSGTWRINVYSAAGESLTSWPTPSGATDPIVVTTSRSLLADTTGRIYYRRPLFDGAREARRSIWFRLRPDGTKLDSIPEPTFRFATRSVVLSAANPRPRFDLPFDPKPVWVPSPLGYFITGIPDRYAFELHIPGSAIHSIRRSDAKALPVTARERETERKRIEERMRTYDRRWSWNGPDIPRTRPFYVGLMTGDDGRIWVPVVPEAAAMNRRTQGTGRAGGGRGSVARPIPEDTLELAAHPALYDVFESTGTYLGQVEVPARVSTRVRRGDYVWAVAFDENDVGFVKRYRINWR